MRLLRHFGSSARRLARGQAPSFPRWAFHRRMFDQAWLVVSAFYVANATFLYEFSRTVSDLSDQAESLDLLWPVAWMDDVGIFAGGRIIANICVFSGLLGVAFWRFLPVRMLVSVAWLLYTAYANSHGAINHGNHEWIWVSVCFWLLPGDRKDRLEASRTGRIHFLTAFSLAPLLILFFYTLSGFYKYWDAAAALLAGRTGGFAPDAMAITIAERAIQTGSQPLWGNLVIDHPLIGWPFYMALYFVELVSLLIFFRPNLHRAWGMLLIAFHFGTLTFMDIVFSKHVLINGLLFVMSPFALGKHDAMRQLWSVPVLGRIIRLFMGRTGATRSKAQRIPSQQPQGNAATTSQDRISPSGHGGVSQ